jgi:hypothetical protein
LPIERSVWDTVVKDQQDGADGGCSRIVTLMGAGQGGKKGGRVTGG